MQREATAMTVRQNLGELLNEVQYRHDKILITKAGKPVAALVDIATYERLRKIENDEFEQLWARLAEGFADVPANALDQQIDRAVKASRTAREGLRTARAPRRGRA